jgi:molybdate/tungstate transport system substrate-binding protein
MKLAEKYYGKPGLAGKLLAKDRNMIRPKETDLLALLESHSLDYLFLYRSVAKQHGLKMLPLPDEINLKRAEFKGLYQTATVTLSGKRPGETMVRRGEPMVYGITIPKSSPNRSAAIAFVAFVLDARKGMKVIESMGQPTAVPSPCEGYDRLPAVLKRYAMK